jgi:hypothetical protein
LQQRRKLNIFPEVPLKGPFLEPNSLSGFKKWIGILKIGKFPLEGIRENIKFSEFFYEKGVFYYISTVWVGK